MSLILVVVFIFLLNIPFGYWRSNTSRLSTQWLMAIHIPVPLAIWVRFLLLGWNWTMLPVFVAAFAAGQYSGGKLRNYLVRREQMSLSSCLVMDVVRKFSPIG